MNQAISTATTVATVATVTTLTTASTLLQLPLGEQLLGPHGVIALKGLMDPGIAWQKLHRVIGLKA
jgi:hypothetical protein